MIDLSAFESLLFIEKLLAIQLFFRSIELVSLRQHYGDKGVWRWSTLSSEIPQLAYALRMPVFHWLVWIRALLCVFLLLKPLLLAWAAVFLISVLILLRFRGSFNGGSDYMGLIILMALLVARLFSSVPEVLLGAVWYIAVQAGLSFFVAGVIKIKRRSWRSGEALRGFLQQTIFAPGRFTDALLSRPKLVFVCSWMVIIFEISFPAAFISREFCVIYLSAAFLFQLANAYLFGLNRFLWTWVCTYPALYFVSL